MLVSLRTATIFRHNNVPKADARAGVTVANVTNACPDELRFVLTPRQINHSAIFVARL